MNRPTCETCPHRVRYRDSYGCARETPRGVVVGDTLLAAAPYVQPDYPGCIHHPDMPDWVAQQRKPVQQPQSRADWRSNSRPEYPSQVEAVRAFIGAPTWQQAREKRERQAQPVDGQQQAAAPEQLAELEQWRGSIVWCKDSIDRAWSLIIRRTGKALAYVMLTNDDWWVGVGRQLHPTRDAAMRAAETAFGLPRCRVEGECT